MRGPAKKLGTIGKRGVGVILRITRLPFLIHWRFTVEKTLVLCAWCDGVISKGVRDEDGGCSHGICIPCKLEYFSDMYTEEEIKEMQDEVGRR